MSNLAVKYDNKMNLLAFKDLDKVEANLFFSIVARAKEKGGRKNYPIFYRNSGVFRSKLHK